MDVTIVVHNVPIQMTEAAIRNVFDVYGQTTFVRKKTDVHGKPYAVVRYKYEHEADGAIVSLDGKKPLYFSVNYARTDAERKDLSNTEPPSELIIPAPQDAPSARPSTPPFVHLFKQLASLKKEK